MLCIVNGRAVERDVVLVIVASTHKDACAALGARLDTREFLYGFEHIRLTQEHGDRQDLFLAERNGTHLRGCYTEVVAAAIDHNILKMNTTGQSTAVIRDYFCRIDRHCP